MSITYSLPPVTVTELVGQVMNDYHRRLIDWDVRVGVLMAYAAVDEDSGERIGTAIKGYVGAAAAQVKIVSLKDRVTKGYDVEMLIDGDAWPELEDSVQTALIDHELTHILPKGETDDLGRPKLKLREEDFIAWGFWEVIRRHGPAAMEHRSLERLKDKHVQLMLENFDSQKEAA